MQFVIQFISNDDERILRNIYGRYIENSYKWLSVFEQIANFFTTFVYVQNSSN